MREEDKRVSRCHEAGHALVAFFEPKANKPRKITIIPRGDSGGATYTIPEESIGFRKKKVIAEIKVALGGRAAEEIVLDDISSGAEGDLKQARALVEKYVAAWGMDEEIGLVAYLTENQFLRGSTLSASDMKKFQIENRITAIIGQLYQETLALIINHRDKLDALIQALTEKETLDEKEIATILA